MANIKSTILIVDDMPTNIEVLNEILGSDYEILFATNGKDALEIASEQVPDLILLDVVMPDMDGYQVCAKLKSEEKTKDIPIIFVSANDSEEDESRGLNAGVIDYLTKPIRPSIVKARVHNHLELKRYRDYLKNLSTIDGLTGVSNRRKFDEFLDIEWRRARRNQTPISLILMDIDFFKSYNDHYGHLAGDECLRKITAGAAEICRRPGDLFARYGGEEFAEILPDTDSRGARCVADRIQEKISALKIPHVHSQVADRVTMSMGIATIVPGDNQTQFDLIQAADELLYQAKQNGRNQIKEKETGMTCSP